jgi:steroid delta-isomerase-like uncharacterized protein
VSSDVVPGAGAPVPDDVAEAARRLLEQTFSEGRFELVDELVAVDAISHDPAAPPELSGLGGAEMFKRTVSMYRAAFPDVRMIVDDVIAADDKVVLRWHSEGTHRGQLAGLAPTGVRGSVTGITINRWKNGKIVESWAEWDNLGLARQVGAAPPVGSVGERIGTRLQHLTAHRMRRRHAT